MLTLQYLPYSEIEYLDSEKRVKKLLDIVRKERIILLEGKLRREEEALLIKSTMEVIDEIFKGIEIATVDPKKDENVFRKIVSNILFKNRLGMTIIGPASIVKEIRKDPKKIELLMNSHSKRNSEKKQRKGKANVSPMR